MSKAIDLLPPELRGEAPGAIPNGRRIVKVLCEEGDAHPVGTRGTVLASKKMPPEALDDIRKKIGREPASTIIYVVEWDALPGLPVGVISEKIRELE